jgi:hypothetical protein
MNGISCILGLFFVLFTLPVAADWSGSGSSSTATDKRDQKAAVQADTFRLGMTDISFPTGSRVARLGHEMVWNYDGRQYVSTRYPDRFDALVNTYAGDAVPEGSVAEWSYKYADTGHGIIYVATHRTIKNLYMAGIVERGVIRQLDAYVRAALNNVSASLPTTEAPATQPK